MPSTYLIILKDHAVGQFLGSRGMATPLRERAEHALDEGREVVFDFASTQATQGFIDELIGVLVLKRDQPVLDSLVFKSCSEDVKAIIQFVVSDRCEQLANIASAQPTPPHPTAQTHPS